MLEIAVGGQPPCREGGLNSRISFIHAVERGSVMAAMRENEVEDMKLYIDFMVH